MSDGSPFFLLACRQCGDLDHLLAFSSAAERGSWAAGHTRETGHNRWWVKDSGCDGEEVHSPLVAVYRTVVVRYMTWEKRRAFTSATS